MMWSWFRSRFLSGGSFLVDALSFLCMPAKLMARLRVGEAESFNDAFDFVWAAIKTSIFLVFVTAYFTDIGVNQTVWYVVRILQFLTVGAITCGLLLLMREQRATLENIYHFFAYPGGFLILISSLVPIALMATGAIGMGGYLIDTTHESWPLVQLYDAKHWTKYVFFIVPAIGLYSIVFFVWALRTRISIPVWKTLIAVLIALPVAMLTGLLAFGVELAFLNALSG